MRIDITNMLLIGTAAGGRRPLFGKRFSKSTAGSLEKLGGRREPGEIADNGVGIRGKRSVTVQDLQIEKSAISSLVGRGCQGPRKSPGENHL